MPGVSTNGTDQLVDATWSENSSYATINGTGLLTTGDVSSDQPCRIVAEYSAGGVTKSAYLDITIKDIIIQVITVTSPNGGETWAAGSTHDVAWTRRT